MILRIEGGRNIWLVTALLATTCQNVISLTGYNNWRKKTEQYNQKIIFFIDSFIFHQKDVENRKYNRFPNVRTKERVCSQILLTYLVFDRCLGNWFDKMEKTCYYSYQTIKVRGLVPWFNRGEKVALQGNCWVNNLYIYLICGHEIVNYFKINLQYFLMCHIWQAFPNN